MEEPSKKCNLSNVEKVIPFAYRQRSVPFNDGIKGMKRRTRFHIDEFPLLSEQVQPEKKYADEQAYGRSRPYQRRANEVVLYLIIGPTAHAKSEVLERPIERRGSQNIELVRVRNQGVVRRPHGNIEVPEVPKER